MIIKSSLVAVNIILLVSIFISSYLAANQNSLAYFVLRLAYLLEFAILLFSVYIFRIDFKILLYLGLILLLFPIAPLYHLAFIFLVLGSLKHFLGHKS